MSRQYRAGAAHPRVLPDGPPLRACGAYSAITDEWAANIAGMKRLAADVLYQAGQDLKRPKHRDQAILFVKSEGFDLLAGVFGLDGDACRERLGLGR
jgi:hypothetical protein